MQTVQKVTDFSQLCACICGELHPKETTLLCAFDLARRASGQGSAIDGPSDLQHGAAGPSLGQARCVDLVFTTESVPFRRPVLCTLGLAWTGTEGLRRISSLPAEVHSLGQQLTTWVGQLPIQILDRPQGAHALWNCAMLTVAHWSAASRRHPFIHNMLPHLCVFRPQYVQGTAVALAQLPPGAGVQPQAPIVVTAARCVLCSYLHNPIS
jgi:hypothetical protein